MTRTEAIALAPQIDTLAQAMTGDEQAFADLVRRNQRMVFSIAWHFFQDRTLAEDLAQDVFLQLYQNMRSIESEAHLTFWLRQVATRKCIDHARWQEKRRHVSLDDAGEFGGSGKDDDVLENERLRRLVVGLPPQFRAVVTLRYQEDLQPAEIAAALGWPVNSVKSRLHRALKMLKERL